MGTMKKYVGAYGFESGQLVVGDTTTSASCIPFKTTTGADITQPYWLWSTGCSTMSQSTHNNYNMRNLIPVATSDSIGNYDVTDYTAISAANINYTTQRTIQPTSARLTYAITITNNDTSSVTVSCIKFCKRFISAYRTSDCTATWSNALCYGYFLDNPITLEAGESATLSVVFKVGE